MEIDRDSVEIDGDSVEIHGDWRLVGFVELLEFVELIGFVGFVELRIVQSGLVGGEVLIDPDGS